MKNHDHSNLLAAVQQKQPQQSEIFMLADLFKVFGDSTRMRILCALFETELCVCAICELLDMNQSAISHQLKVLKDAKLLGCRRAGKTVYYYLADSHVRTIIHQGMEHLNE